MPVIGSDKNPVKIQPKTGKGSNPRPGFYTQEYRDNFDKIFGKKGTKTAKSESA